MGVWEFGSPLINGLFLFNNMPLRFKFPIKNMALRVKLLALSLPNGLDAAFFEQFSALT